MNTRLEYLCDKIKELSQPIDWMDFFGVEENEAVEMREDAHKFFDNEDEANAFLSYMRDPWGYEK